MFGSEVVLVVLDAETTWWIVDKKFAKTEWQELRQGEQVACVVWCVAPWACSPLPIFVLYPPYYNCFDVICLRCQPQNLSGVFLESRLCTMIVQPCVLHQSTGRDLGQKTRKPEIVGYRNLSIETKYGGISSRVFIIV